MMIQTTVTITASTPSTASIPTTLRLTPAERKVWRKRRPIAPSVWAERHRVLTMSSVPGRWKNRTAPYLAGIMDAAAYKSIEEIVVCAAPQTGKSEAVNTFIGYCVDRAPGSVLYIFPDEQTARENSRDRIQPMITASNRLRSYMTGYDDDVSNMTIRLQHMQIYLGWARSASRLANKPLPYVVFDEVDKFPDTAGAREAGPIQLGEKRTRTFRGSRKIFKLSTPTIEDGNVWRALNDAAAVFDFHVRCPFCNASQLMDFDHIKFPDDARDPIEMKNHNLAWYECASCAAHWTDDDRNTAVRAGVWKDRENGLSIDAVLKSMNPLSIGFHLPSWISYFVGLSEVASDFLRGLQDKTALKDFLNNHKAEPWKEYEITRKEDTILKLADDRPRGRVPGENQVAAIVAGVDTQDNGFYYEIRAFGFGLEQPSWQIREGFVLDFTSLAQVLWQDQYLDSADNPYLVRLAVIDAMGHRTAEVYDFCRQYRGHILPAKGKQQIQQPFAYSNLEYYPGNQKPIPGGLRLVRINTNFFKNHLANRLDIAPADPGAWHLHSETTAEYARHMIAEYIDEKGLWQCPPGRANHYWDCAVYALAAADIIGVKHWQPASPQKPHTPSNPHHAAAPRGGRW